MRGLLIVKQDRNRIRMIRILTLPGRDGRPPGGKTGPKQDTNDKNINPTWTDWGGLLAVKWGRYRTVKRTQMIRILTLDRTGRSPGGQTVPEQDTNDKN
jgi:hypothetical protein